MRYRDKYRLVTSGIDVKDEERDQIQVYKWTNLLCCGGWHDEKVEVGEVKVQHWVKVNKDLEDEREQKVFFWKNTNIIKNLKIDKKK